MKVGDKFRENPMSTIPGGYTVTVKYKGKQPLEYDKIKYTKKYTEKILREAKKNGELSEIEYIEDNNGTILYKPVEGYELPF